jgi:hypothetical protein
MLQSFRGFLNKIVGTADKDLRKPGTILRYGGGGDP